MSDTKISMDQLMVSAKPLQQLLEALTGPGHLIREIQYTRGSSLIENPIDKLIDEYNAWVKQVNEEHGNAGSNDNGGAGDTANAGREQHPESGPDQA